MSPIGPSRRKLMSAVMSEVGGKAEVAVTFPNDVIDPKPPYAGTVILSQFRTPPRHRSRAERMVYPDVPDRGNDRRRSTSAPTGFGGSKCRTNQRADPGARTGQQHSDDEGHVEPITNRDADQGSAAG